MNANALDSFVQDVVGCATQFARQRGGSLVRMRLAVPQGVDVPQLLARLDGRLSSAGFPDVEIETVADPQPRVLTLEFKRWQL